MRIWTWLLVALLAGCSSMDITKIVMEKDPTIAGKPEPYRAGFDDGCRSGVYEYRGSLLKGDGFVRDDARMKTDTDYALGWQDGARRCLAWFGGGTIFVAPRR